MTATIAAFYRFMELTDLPRLRAELNAAFAGLELGGTFLLAPEGVNGTVAGSAASIETMLRVLTDKFQLARAEVKFSHAEKRPFNRLKIRLKKEIITFKQPQIDPVNQAGAYVAPQDWNALLADKDVVVFDTRNSYETELGTFNGALVPNIKTFTEFAGFVRDNLAAAKNKKIAMFCTGGIRCEKASAFMRAEGFNEVYHLKGGILKYLEEIPAAQSQWRGGCFVFDHRGAVGQGLVPVDLQP